MVKNKRQEELTTLIKTNITMRKSYLMILLSGTMLIPTTTTAQTSGSDDDDITPGQHRAPSNKPFSIITYDENSGVAKITFLTAITDAEIIIWQDGVQVNSQSLVATKGTQIPIHLPVYGYGEFSIQVKSGSTLIAIYYTTL